MKNRAAAASGSNRSLPDDPGFAGERFVANGWLSAISNLALKFGPDVFLPACTTCAVIFYNRNDWSLLLFVFGVNCAFLGYRLVSRKMFG